MTHDPGNNQLCGFLLLQSVLCLSEQIISHKISTAGRRLEHELKVVPVEPEVTEYGRDNSQINFATLDFFRSSDTAVGTKTTQQPHSLFGCSS